MGNAYVHVLNRLPGNGLINLLGERLGPVWTLLYGVVFSCWYGLGWYLGALLNFFAGLIGHVICMILYWILYIPIFILSPLMFIFRFLLWIVMIIPNVVLFLINLLLVVSGWYLFLFVVSFSYITRPKRSRKNDDLISIIFWAHLSACIIMGMLDGAFSQVSPYCLAILRFGFVNETEWNNYYSIKDTV
jgi:hypothetical protein